MQYDNESFHVQAQKKAVEGLLDTERERRVSETRQQGEKVYRGTHRAEVLDGAMGKPAAGARAAAAWEGRDRANGTL